MKISPVSGDLVVKLALFAAGGVGLWLLWRKLPSVGGAAKAAGNLGADAATGTVHAAATGLGSVLVGTVEAVPGLTDYLKSISDPNAVPGTEIAPGVVDVNGQTFNFGY